ncbi:magnesium-dependent phosphatase-1 [Filobasidium floriforme]|uniref:magnesium-dependent phosphatase-1 n=1 Tax=Filobasidium floriforme TaxID=5210 RepID=UPI001E8D15C0|nr:magnesium-dependent phosphatase-1 [Filobasidium floriforme]KAH8084608.1 magnesium-dependent phosphatase-1 [Filobasidium floriforme]
MTDKSINVAKSPKVVVFDLEIDTHITPKLTRKGDTVNELVDRHGTKLSFYDEVPDILQTLKDTNIHVAAASRTCAPDLAREALRLLLMPNGEKAITYFDTMEIYPGSKIKHFKEIHKKTGIPYSEMLFFDDEARNKETESLGVTMMLVTHGVDKATYNKGVKKWRERNGHA